ncbi:MAG: class I SAM-dependent methyltransferase [Phreatobacter sp.]|uniref:class I SAM-dependent methyltransferase n=1 Tax=Phreatobacter sp. TaxID=1966341 RepID=UPI001A3E0F71|nr:class I SAM-dependent methyltransferase [Phreatobacter sp.]MBL8568678.1 class I SAM-dependent methyltransferase [Phreatobacter sp.]
MTTSAGLLPSAFGLFGEPPAELAAWPPTALQFSPLVPGSVVLEDQPAGSLAGMVMLGPPGTIERRYAVALALRALETGAELTVLAPKDKGGSRLRKELEVFGCTVSEDARRHHRICTTARPIDAIGFDEAIVAGAPRIVETLGLWSQPGVFAWDRIDPGSALLLEHLPPLAGRGADLGCGIGVLSRAVLAASAVTELTLVDLDRRAIDCARRNVADPRARFVWADLRREVASLAGLDFVVTNPPFHDGGAEDRALGQAFVRRAAGLLRRGGRLLLVANRHLPYEAVLKASFRSVSLRVEAGGYKVYEAEA